MLFSGWYTDTMMVYRIQKTKVNNMSREVRTVVNDAPIPCRVYRTQISGSAIQETAATDRKTDKLACPIDTDIKENDEIIVTRGALVGGTIEERYIAGNPQRFYDPVGMHVTGLEHLEVGLFADNIVK